MSSAIEGGKLHWYKITKPIDGYSFCDFEKGLVGYTTMQNYPNNQYLGYLTYPEVVNNQHIAFRSWNGMKNNTRRGV